MRAARILSAALASSLALSCATSATSQPSGARGRAGWTSQKPHGEPEATGEVQESASAPATSPASAADESASSPPRDREWYEAQYGGCAQLSTSRAGSAALTDKQRAALEQLVRGSATPDGTGEGKLDLGPLGEGVRGSLSKEHIRSVIQAGLDDVRGCYERALDVWPSAAGRVVVNFLIAPDGTVPRAEVTQSQTSIAEIGCCISTVVRSWTFSKPEGGGIVIVSYPFLLKPDMVPESAGSGATNSRR